MKRRSFFGAFAALAGLVLTPIRAAEARIRAGLRPLRWHGLTPRWEHLAEPVPVERPQDYVVAGENDAKVVCRLLRPTHSTTLMTDEEFLPAMREVGWGQTHVDDMPEESEAKWRMIEQRRLAGIPRPKSGII
jgi:hypothetical protein